MGAESSGCIGALSVELLAEREIFSFKRLAGESSLLSGGEPDFQDCEQRLLTRLPVGLGDWCPVLWRGAPAEALC